jgi:hypothetical protein
MRLLPPSLRERRTRSASQGKEQYLSEGMSQGQQLNGELPMLKENPHLNPLPEGEEDAQRLVRVQSQFERFF